MRFNSYKIRRIRLGLGESVDLRSWETAWESEELHMERADDFEGNTLSHEALDCFSLFALVYSLGGASLLDLSSRLKHDIEDLLPCFGSFQSCVWKHTSIPAEMLDVVAKLAVIIQQPS